MTMTNQRRHNFKQTISSQDCRRQRQETALQIRKNKQEERLHKRRHAGANNETCSINDITKLSKLLASQTEKLYATRQIRGILSISDEGDLVSGLAQTLINHGVLRHMLQNISNPTNDVDLTLESCWVLTNIASSQHADAVVHAGAIELLVQLLKFPRADVREHAAECLGNISMDDVSYRDCILAEEDAIPWISQNIREPVSLSLLKTMLWTLDCLLREEIPRPSLNQREIETIVKAMKGVLCQLAFPLHDNDAIDLASYSTRILHRISDGNKEVIQVIINNGMLPHVIAILKCENIPIKLMVPAIKCLGSFVTGTDDQAQIVIDYKVLPFLLQMLGSPCKHVRKQACWILSNIAAGSIDQKTALMKVRGMIKTIYKHAMEAPWELRKEAILVFSNIMVSGSDDQVMALIQFEGLRPITKILSVGHADPSVLCDALDALEQVLHVSDRQGLKYERIFQEYNGIDYLEALQYHGSDEVYTKAVKIIDTFFGVGDLEEENLAPETMENGTFGFGAPSPKRLFADARPPLQFGQVSNRR